MHVDVLHTRPELELLRTEWNSLLQQSRACSIFLTWEWINAWLDAARPDAALLVIVVRDDDGHLLAIAPFYRTRLNLLGTLSYRCLRVLGDVDSSAEYPDIIVRADRETELLGLLSQSLRQSRDLWDCLWLPAVAGWTGALARFAALCGAGHCVLHQRPVDFGAIPLPGTYDAYLMLLSHKRRGYVRRAARSLATEHQLKMMACRTPEELSILLPGLFDLHYRHWLSCGQDGVFRGQRRKCAFYERFARVALDKGWLRLSGLSVDGELKAVQYGYAYGGTFYAVQEGYEPQAGDGVGNVLRNMVLEACISENLACYDFMAGFNEHKRLWRAVPRVGYDLFVVRKSLKSIPLRPGRIWPTGRFLKPVDGDGPEGINAAGSASQCARAAHCSAEAPAAE